MTQNHLSLLGAGSELPEGFKYQPPVVSAEDERRLLERIKELPLKPFAFHGFTGKRHHVDHPAITI